MQLELPFRSWIPPIPLIWKHSKGIISGLHPKEGSYVRENGNQSDLSITEALGLFRSLIYFRLLVHTIWIKYLAPAVFDWIRDLWIKSTIMVVTISSNYYCNKSGPLGMDKAHWFWFSLHHRYSVKGGRTSTPFTKTNDQLANVFTKSLHHAIHQTIISEEDMIDINASTKRDRGKSRRT